MSSPTGTWHLFTKEGGALLSGCPGGVKCEYGAPAGGVTLKGSNEAGGANVKAAGVTLAYKSGSGEGLCGSTGTWTAEYKAGALELVNSSGGTVGTHTSWWFRY
jgi:hypothetical protein